MCAILPLRLKRRFTSKQKQQRNGKILWHHWCDNVIVYHISFSKDCNRYRLDISLNLHEQMKQYSAKRINVSSVYHQSNRVISILYNLSNLTGSSTVDHSFIQIYYILWYQSKAQRLYIWTPRDTPPPLPQHIIGIWHYLRMVPAIIMSLSEKLWDECYCTYPSCLHKWYHDYWLLMWTVTHFYTFI